jgi:hypothetical protein
MFIIPGNSGNPRLIEGRVQSIRRKRQLNRANSAEEVKEKQAASPLLARASELYGPLSLDRAIGLACIHA